MSIAQIEARLFAGQRLLKTMDPDTATGASWVFEDGRSARADLCEKLLAAGVIKPLRDGLFDEFSQSHVLAPFDGTMAEFVSQRHGSNWCVAKRRTKKLLETYDTVVLPREYAACEREWKARHAERLAA